MFDQMKGPVPYQQRAAMRMEDVPESLRPRSQDLDDFFGTQGRTGMSPRPGQQ